MVECVSRLPYPRVQYPLLTLDSQIFPQARPSARGNGSTRTRRLLAEQRAARRQAD